MAQRLLHFGVQDISQFMGVVAIGGLVDEGLHGCHQSSVAGEPDRFVRPQSAIVKASDLGQRVEAPAMGVAGVVAKLLQLAEHRQIGIGAERAFQINQFGDFVAAEVPAKDRGIEGGRSHNVIVPTDGVLQQEL